MHLKFNALSISPSNRELLYHKGTYNPAYVVLKQATDDKKFYYSITITSGKSDVLVDDFYIFDKPDYSDVKKEIAFYQYLKCLADMTISDIKLVTNYIYLVGPSGIINNRFNEDKCQAEVYQLEHANEFYSNIYVKFLSYLNDVLKMREIINQTKSFISVEVPFRASLFGYTPVSILTRKYRHGDLKIKLQDVPSFRKENHSVFSCSDEIANRYNIDNTRRIFAYKALLDYYIEHGETKCDTDFLYDNMLKKIYVDKDGVYYSE